MHNLNVLLKTFLAACKYVNTCSIEACNILEISSCPFCASVVELCYRRVYLSTRLPTRCKCSRTDAVRRRRSAVGKATKQRQRQSESEEEGRVEAQIEADANREEQQQQQQKQAEAAPRDAFDDVLSCAFFHFYTHAHTHTPTSTVRAVYLVRSRRTV